MLVQNVEKAIERIQSGKPFVLVPRKQFTENVRSNQGKFLRCFMNSDLRMGHDGLTLVAKKEGIDVLKLEPGELVIFFNASRDRFKVFAHNHMVVYYKSPHGRVEMTAIQRLPAIFNATGRVDFDKAVRDTIEESLRKKRGVVAGE